MKQGQIMKNLAKVLLLAGLWLCLTSNLVLAAPVNADATCDISVTVAEIMEWSGNFTAITLANITAQNSQVEDDETVTLYTNGDVSITADNTVAAELDNDGASTDTLVTEYKIAFDASAAPDTFGTPGAKGATYQTYDQFLNGTAATVTHSDGDGAIDVTLYVQASNDTGQVADSGAYSCTQTLTAAWAS